MEKLLYLLLVLLVVGAIWLEAWYFADFRRKIGTFKFILLVVAVFTAVFFISYFGTIYWGNHGV